MLQQPVIPAPGGRCCCGHGQEGPGAGPVFVLSSMSSQSPPLPCCMTIALSSAHQGRPTTGSTACAPPPPPPHSPEWPQRQHHHHHHGHHHPAPPPPPPPSTAATHIDNIIIIIIIIVQRKEGEERPSAESRTIKSAWLRCCEQLAEQLGHAALAPGPYTEWDLWGSSPHAVYTLHVYKGALVKGNEPRLPQTLWT